MMVLQREMAGIVFKIERINTGVLWEIYQELKECGKATPHDRNALLINLN